MNDVKDIKQKYVNKIMYRIWIQQHFLSHSNKRIRIRWPLQWWQRGRLARTGTSGGLYLRIEMRWLARRRAGQAGVHSLIDLWSVLQYSTLSAVLSDRSLYPRVCVRWWRSYCVYRPLYSVCPFVSASCRKYLNKYGFYTTHTFIFYNIGTYYI